jgi:hypothetical protein
VSDARPGGKADRLTTALHHAVAARKPTARGPPVRLGDQSFVTRSVADYNRINVDYGGDPALVTGLAVPQGGALTDLAAIRDYVAEGGGTAQFLVVSDNMEAYSEYFGHLQDGS